MRKVRRLILFSVLTAFLLLIVYTIWDNNRIVIVKEDIIISNLPEKLENFKILQISDLHEKEFGKNQKGLIEKINNIDYDVIVFTGDILVDPESTHYESFYTLLEGINNKENVLFVPGNSDPPSYQVTPSFGTSAFISGMEDRGVRFLESFDTIDVGGESIHFVNLELSIIENPEQIGSVNGSFKPFYASDDKYQAHQKDLWEDMMYQDILSSTDVIIAINHYPVPDPRIDYIQNDPATAWRDFDLIIAGHYHGGQIRLPFLGSFFIPEPWYKPNSFFPPQDRVKGLWEYDGMKQYVSAGLGSSEAISFFNFRLFNPPEINVLTLKKQ